MAERSRFYDKIARINGADPESIQRADLRDLAKLTRTKEFEGDDEAVARIDLLDGKRGMGPNDVISHRKISRIVADKTAS